MNPIVESVFKRMRDSGRTFEDVAEQSGLSVSTIKGWRKHEPKLGNLEAVTQSLGGCISLEWSDDWHECDWCGTKQTRGIIRDNMIFCGRCNKPIKEIKD